MVASLHPLDVRERPFPGLRAFDTDESLLFFGRELHTEALLRRLSENRFLAVVGSSGCGKSSLVRAGLLPSLFRGYLVGATSRWRCAVLRPGVAPLDALAKALADERVLGASLGRDELRSLLGATSGGLIEATLRAKLGPGESLLVVVDQFEELFRFAREGGGGDGEGQAALFVSLLLRAVESETPIYVTLTMRSDYQGDCAQFPGLPEALNRSQYLVPRLTRAQRREAIVRPLELAGTGATPRLVNRLLNDAGEDPDQLPVLQHALLQTYRVWREHGGEGEVDLPHYEAVGGIGQALGRHGDSLYEGLAPEDAAFAERVFRALTTFERGRAVRRPKELQALCAVTRAVSPEERRSVANVVGTYARRENSLLLQSVPELAPETVVDITHESLIRKWPRLERWAQEENRSSDWYGDLARDVVRKRTGDAATWRDPELSSVLARRTRERWNEAWADQYRRAGDPPFAEIEGFLAESSADQKREARRRELARRRTNLILLLLLVTIVSAVSFTYYQRRRQDREVRSLSQQVQTLQTKADDAQKKADGLKAKSEEARLAYLTASTGEREALLRQYQELEARYKESQTAANRIESQSNSLRQSPELVASDQSKLLKRIQDLQDQLNAATGERDKLRAAQQANARGIEANDLLERVGRLERQVLDLTAERDQLQKRAQGLEVDLRQAQAAAQAGRGGDAAPSRPVLVVVPENSAVRVAAAPFRGNLVLAVGDVHSDPSSHVRAFVWTPASGRSDNLPAEYFGEKRKSKELIGRMEEANSCGENPPPAPLCYRLQRSATLRGSQAPARFSFAGAAYEVRAAGWETEDGKSISFVIYPAPPAASAR